MCTAACLEFTRTGIAPHEIVGADILEVGSRDHNGTVRSLIQRHGPRSYVGLDMLDGPGVDVVGKAEHLVERFGVATFDVVIATELLEHAQHWRDVVRGLKGVLRPGGLLLLTTRSKGFPFHDCPLDFWRYEQEDFRRIFADMDIERLESDDLRTPGVLLRARRPAELPQADLEDIHLYSIVARRRIADAGPISVLAASAVTACRRAARATLPKWIVRPLRNRIWRILSEP